MSVNRHSREAMSTKKAIKQLISYEDQITMETEKAVHKIRDRAKILHSDIDKFITDMLTQLKHKFEREMKRIRIAVEKLKGGDSKGSSRSSSLERTPRYRSTPKKSGIDFGIQQTISIDLDDMGEDAFEKKEMRFVEGEISEANFKKMFGHFTLEPVSIIPLSTPVPTLVPRYNSEVKLIKTFKCGDWSETVHAIAPALDDQAWVCSGWGSRNISLFDRFGEQRNCVTLDVPVNDLAAFYDGKDDLVLISSYREKSIKSLNQDTLRTSDFAYISLYPGGLCSDGRSGIYVCFRDSYHKPVTFGSRRMVAKLSKEGKIVQTAEKDDDQKNIFGYPFRVAVNRRNGDICVSDYGEGTRGVTILHKDGRLRNCYKAPQTNLSSQPFLPHGICCDDDGHILVSDWNNDCVHVLDEEGNFMLYLVTKQDGLEGPNAIAVDRRGDLWVGDSHGRIRVFKYKLY